jgi:hypothetical protein
MSIQSINTEIIQGNFTNEQLSSIIDAVKFARARLTDATKRTLRLGSTVKFTSSKTGITMQGTVNKIAIKYITVQTQQGLWRVPANMLEVV